MTQWKIAVARVKRFCGRNPIWEIDSKLLTLNAPFNDSLGKKFF
jgi:hypothetical protein